MNNYKLGATPSPKDSRDYRIAYKTSSGATFPSEFEIKSVQEVRNQGDEGTCVAHALVNGLMGHMQRLSPCPDAPYDRILSVRDAYEGARRIEPVFGEGSHPRAALKYAHKTGICLEQDWPYIPKQRLSESQNAKKTRQQNKIQSYFRVNNTIDDIKATLQNQGVLLIVVPVYRQFYSPDSRGVVVIDEAQMRHGQIDGYHAVCIVGWNDNLGWKIRNSWGKEWGVDGHCYIPFNYPITELWFAIPALNNNEYEPQQNWFEVIWNFIFRR